MMWLHILGGLLTLWGGHPTHAEQGTTTNLHDIFIGRCWDYQRIINKGYFINGVKDCDQLWSQFRTAFAFKMPCDVPLEAFEPFAREVLLPGPRDKTMFWTGVYEFVHEFNHVIPEYTVIADTMAGYIANDLLWCGQKETPGINFNTCPEWSSCPNNANDAVMAYWKAASRVFAGNADGLVKVMLNGSVDNAFRSSSIFATDELPILLTSTKVTEIEALVVHEVGMLKKDFCGKGSLKTLETKVKAAGKTYKCIEDLVEIRLLLCVDNMEATECKRISKLLGIVSSARQVQLQWSFLSLILFIYYTVAL